MNKVKFKLILIVIFSLTSFLLLKFIPILDFSSEPSVFSGGAFYFLKNVLTSGHLISLAEANSISMNIFSGNISEYARYPFFPILYSMISLISGIGVSSWAERLIKSIIFALPILLLSLCIYFSISKRIGKKIDIKFAFLISIYSLMASPYIINQLGANGWVFILFASYLIFIQTKDRWELSFLSIIFLAFLPAAYFTGSSFFILWISIAMVLIFIMKKFNVMNDFKKSYYTVFSILVVCYLGYAIYISTTRYIPAIEVFFNVIETIRSGFSGFETSSPLLPSKYIVQTSLESKLRNLINGILVALPIVFLYLSKNRLKEFKETTLFILAGILALPCLAFLSFFWLGQFGLVRLQEYGSLISLIVVAFISPVLVDKEKTILAVIMILAIISSIFAYYNDESTNYRYITNQEEDGAKWIENNINNDSFIFTDHRLSGTLISNGFLRTNGISEFDENPTESIDQIYYAKDSKNVSQIIRSYGANYLYFSKSMSDNSPGIMLYNYPIKPAPYGFYEVYNTDFNRLYDNGQSYVYNLPK